MKQRLQYLQATVDRQRRKEIVFERDTSGSSNRSGATILPTIFSSSSDYVTLTDSNKSYGPPSPCSPTSCARQSPEQCLNRSLHNIIEGPLDHSSSESTLYTPSPSAQPYASSILGPVFLQNLSTSTASHTVPSLADTHHDYSIPQHLMSSQASLPYFDVLRQRDLPRKFLYLF